MKIAGGFLLVLFLAVGLTGCIHATGPCYGVGCHAFTAPSGAQSQTTSNTDSGKKHGHNLLKKIKL